MHTYKLKQEYLKDGERTFIGVGVTKEGVIESATPLESPLLEEVREAAAPAPSAAAPPQPTSTNIQEQK